jgi:putative FmdB family regulatory protein
MARYTYKCEKCEMEQEVDHGMTENPEIKCETCDEVLFRVITGGSGVSFKVTSGLRSEGHVSSAWAWGCKRPDPRTGHKLGAEERKAIEEKHIKKYVKRMTDKTPAMSLDKIVPKALNSMVPEKKKIIL